jgi:hypothetical protein
METDSRIVANRAKSVIPIVVCVFAILVVFLLLLAIGNPIPQFGNLGSSLVYSLVVYAPVAIVCILALSRSNK